MADTKSGYFHERYTPTEQGSSTGITRQDHQAGYRYQLVPSSPTAGFARASSSSASSALNSGSSSSGDGESELGDSGSDASSMDSDTSEELFWEREAQREWEENMRQLQLAVSVLVLPSIGKWLGRRWAYGIYARYIAVGWNWTIFLPNAWKGILGVPA